MRGAEERVFEFFCDPHWADEEVEDALKECGLVAFDAMASEEKNPAADEEREAYAPPRDAQKDDARDDEGDSDGMHHLVPGIGVLVIVLRHVLA